MATAVRTDTSEPSPRGKVKEVDLGRAAFRIEVTRKAEAEASAAHRKPRSWYEAVVTNRADGSERWRGRVYASDTSERVLWRAGILAWCSPCRGLVPVWDYEPALGCCTNHPEVVAAVVGVPD